MIIFRRDPSPTASLAGCVDMSMILYHGEPNGPSLTALAALFESGVEADLRHIDLLAGERHAIPGLTSPLARDMGVEGEGPVLVINGEAMTESVFIAQFLDESGNGNLQPMDAFAHWQMLMWCRRITERCAPAAAYLGCQANAQGRLSGDFSMIISEDLRARWAAVRDGSFPDASTKDSRAKVADAVQLVEDQLSDGRDWLMGAFSLADLETYGWLAGMTDLVPEAFAAKDRVDRWLARVKARPSVTKALSLASTDAPDASWAPGPEINRWG
jgi:GSH-dependent disulfide-bond oxidoreductase